MDVDDMKDFARKRAMLYDTNSRKKTFQWQLTLATINCYILQETFNRPNAPFETEYFFTTPFPVVLLTLKLQIHKEKQEKDPFGIWVRVKNRTNDCRQNAGKNC